MSTLSQTIFRTVFLPWYQLIFWVYFPSWLHYHDPNKTWEQSSDKITHQRVWLSGEVTTAGAKLVNMTNDSCAVESWTELNGSIAVNKICLLDDRGYFSSLCFSDVGVPGPCSIPVNISLLMLWFHSGCSHRKISPICLGGVMLNNLKCNDNYAYSIV